jgi:hypothetical protein
MRRQRSLLLLAVGVLGAAVAVLLWQRGAWVRGAHRATNDSPEVAAIDGASAQVDPSTRPMLEALGTHAATPVAVVPEGPHVTGRVLGAAGDPIAGARVLALAACWWSTRRWRVTWAG